MGMQKYNPIDAKVDLVGIESAKMIDSEHVLSLDIFQEFFSNQDPSDYDKNFPLRIIFGDMRGPHRIQNTYYFNNKGKLIYAVTQGFDGKSYRDLKPQIHNQLENLVSFGEEIKDMIGSEEIPNKINLNPIIKALKNNEIKGHEKEYIIEY